MQFQSTTDREIIRNIVTHPAIWPHVSDDFSGEPEVWEPPIGDGFLYILALEAGEIRAMWMFEKTSPILFKVHTTVLPVGRGVWANEAAKKMAFWIWEHTECQRIVTDVPENNRLALKFAEAAGMQQFGVNPKSYQKGGKLLGVILLGLSRPQHEPHSHSAIAAGQVSQNESQIHSAEAASHPLTASCSGHN